MQHILKLHPTYFEKIQNGAKTIEVRLFDDKRKQINLGDTIVFLNTSNQEQSISTDVIGLLRFKTFSDLLDSFPIEQFGADNKEEFLKILYSFYSKEEETSLGVIGIKIVLSV